MNNLKLAFRRLLKNWSFTAIVVITIGLGIGANTAIFSIVDAVLLRPPPFWQPEKLVTLWERNARQGYEQNMPAPANFLDWKREARSFEGMALFNSSLSFAVTGTGNPIRIQGAAVSADLFAVLGVRPRFGRVFTPDEEIPGRDGVALIGEGLSQRLFGPDHNPIGNSITLDGVRRTIIGVMPRKFRFPGGTGLILGSIVNEPADVWVPLSYGPAFWQERSHNFLQAIGRLRKDVTLEQAAAELNTIQAQLAKNYQGETLGTHTKIIPLREQSLADVRLGLFVLVGAVVFILLIACANVGNLLLARAAGRQREFAVRLALGAGRMAIFRQLFSEGLLLSLAGGALGVMLSVWSLQALKTFLAGRTAAATPGWTEVSVDGPVLLFTLGVSIICAILFALLPGWQTASSVLHTDLKEGGRGSTSGPRGRRFRSSFVVAQIALALILLVGAALMIQSFTRLMGVPTGFEPAHVLAVTITLPGAKYSEPPQIKIFFEELVRRGHALPGVQTAGMGLMTPFGGAGKNYDFAIEGRPPDPKGNALTADVRLMTPDFFRVLGIPLLRGRPLNNQDIPNSPPVALINETFARRYFPNEEPLGKRITGIAGGPREIVGIVRDFKQQGLADTFFNPQIYTPFAQTAYFNFGTVVVRTAGKPISLADAIRREVAAVDKDLPIDRIETMEEIMAGTVTQPRFRTWVLGLFGALGLLLAVLGIYGVLANSVQQRTNEIGIRMAIGAQRKDVLRLIISQGMRLVAIGIALGLVGTLIFSPFLSGLLYGINAWDPTTVFAVLLVLTISGFFACYLPARRAAKIDPMQALRNE